MKHWRMPALIVIVVAVAVFGVLSLLDNGRHSKKMKPMIQFAEQNEENLEACAEDLLALVSEYAALDDTAFHCFTVYPVKEGPLQLLDVQTGATAAFQSDVCKSLLDDPLIGSISVYIRNGHAIVSFFADAHRVVTIQYLPSEDPRDSLYYTEDYPITTEEDSVWGKEPGGNNWFFYKPITNKLYYEEWFD